MEDFAWNCSPKDEGIEAIESFPTSFSKKNMKIDLHSCFQELRLPSLSFELHSHCSFTLSLENIISPTTSSKSGVLLAGDLCSGDSTSSCCSSNESSLVVKDSVRYFDNEAKGFETESSTCIDNKFSREATPSSDFYVDKDDMESLASAGGKTCRKTFPVEKIRMPTQAEIDEFFVEAEKEEQKRFAEKYNYDVGKDAPLDGRYQWICLKP